MKKTLIVGYGSIAQAVTPLLLKHFDLAPADIMAIAADEGGRGCAESFGIGFSVCALNERNFAQVLAAALREGDILLNLSVNVSSVALIEWCQCHGVLYLDTCVEPWAGGYGTAANTVSVTNHALRDAALRTARRGAPTAVIAHGANPGLVSHFVKAGLTQLALRKKLSLDASWAELAQRLEIRVIQIAERDTQDADITFDAGAFCNTWSVDGLLSEAWQMAEMGWGSHEAVLPANGCRHRHGDRSGIYLGTRSAEVRVKSWVPGHGAQDAYLITHHEALSIAALLTIEGAHADQPVYRPTVYYAYHPAPLTQASLEHWKATGYAPPRTKQILVAQLARGCDQLGALFVFPGGAYWHGSKLTLEQARQCAPCNNATTLQVAAGVIGALRWMNENPARGVVEAESMDHEMILQTAMPYLGEVFGEFTNWQPGAAGELQFADFLASHREPISNTEDAL